MLKKTFKITMAAAAVAVAFTLYIRSLVPDRMYIDFEGNVQIKSLPMVSLDAAGGDGQSELYTGCAPYPADVSANSRPLAYTAKLLGVIPLKNVNVSSSAERMVSVAGTPFGIKMFSDGVMVVGFSDISTPTGSRCPAKTAGLKLGDVIIKLDNQPVKSNRDVENHILKNGDKPVDVTFLRDGVQMSCQLAAVPDSQSGSCRTGMWVRDSSAGVGTMTFYDVQKGMFAGLGHGIKDTDTQKDIRLLSGEIVPVRITGYTPSANGEAGELKGAFISEFATGRIWANSTNGVYGSVFSPPVSNMMEVAAPAEIVTGPAEMLTTINGTEPQRYNIVIEKVVLTGSNQSKNMVIRITDPALLEKTGGIVQGMSGSPIIQNGKLVGAVTHVFVNQVTRGYAVFAQNMLFSMDSTEKVHISSAG